MARVKHTPGPWLHQPVYKAGHLIRNRITAGLREIISDVNDPDDAPIIAAVPDLLDCAYDALFLTNDLMGGVGVTDEQIKNVYEKLISALEKAEGRP